MRMPGTKIGVLVKGQEKADAEAKAKPAPKTEETEEKKPADDGGDENIPTVIVDESDQAKNG